MAPRKTVKATGASKSAATRPLAESSTNALKPSQPRAQKRKATPTEEGASPPASKPAADSKGTESSSKRQRQTEDVHQSSVISDAAPAPETDNNSKHLNAIHRRLIELTEKLTKIDKHAQFQAVATASVKGLVHTVGNSVEKVHDAVHNVNGGIEQIQGDVDDYTKEYTTEDILDKIDDYSKGYTTEDIFNKIDEVLETITDRFDDVDNKMEKLQYEQALGFVRMQHRFDELEWKWEERLQLGRSINVYGPQGQTLQRIQF